MISGPCGLAPVSFSAPRFFRPDSGARFAAAAGSARAGLVIAGVEILPVIERRHRRGKRRRWLPAAVKIAICQNRPVAIASNRNPMPAHAQYPQIPIIQCPISCRRRETRSPASALLIPALFAPSVAKKPHIRLNGRPSVAAGGLPVRLRRHYIGGEPHQRRYP